MDERTWQVGYTELEDSFRTGDLILMHGADATSGMIELLEDSPWSHVTMVVRSRDVGLELKDHPLLVWESNPFSKLEDVELHKPKTGPMLEDLRVRIAKAHEQNDTRFLWRSLHVDRSALDLGRRLRAIIEEIHDATFPSRFGMMFELAAGRDLGREGDLDHFFCSELIGHTYKHLGLLSRRYPAAGYAPMDFLSKYNIPLLKGAWLGPEVEFVPDFEE
jgi:hypothetical protein